MMIQALVNGADGGDRPSPTLMVASTPTPNPSASC
jgi:hypothetical protein